MYKKRVEDDKPFEFVDHSKVSVEEKKEFELFLTELRPDAAKELLQKFEDYQYALWEENQKVNLVSRKTLAQDYWINHFLDSILGTKHVSFSGKKVLDFGTGGGFPGIPIALLFPSSEVFLLDSKQKKIKALKIIAEKLDLKNCFTIVSRIEELAPTWFGSFDYIVSRSVKITPEYVPVLFRLLKPEGKLVLYKSKILDDTEQFENKKIIDISHPKIGERKLVIIWEK